MKKKTKKPVDPVEAFIALPDSEKDRIFAELEAGTPEQRLAASRPMNKQERALWQKRQAIVRRGRGRPKVGAGVAKVSLSVERSLLDRADAYAKSHRLNRSELVAKSLARFLGAA